MSEYQLLPDWPPNGGAVVRTADNQIVYPDSAGWQAYQDWLKAKNTPLAAPLLTATQEYAKRLAAGLAIVSTGTSALNANYAVHTDAQRVIAAIYAGIKGGDGVPGNGATFAYQDATGTSHLFTADQFAAFAKAVRDYVYALTIAVGQATPVWPTASATIA